MKKIIGVFAIGLLVQQFAWAQGTVVYLSNLNQPTASSNSVGSDSWLATCFRAGTNAGGYSLDSVELQMANATGSPSNIAVAIYSASGLTDVNPASSLGTLNGPANPSTAGVYTYTDNAGLILSPNTEYFVILTASTTVANGAYEWVNSSTHPVSYNPSDGWKAPFGDVRIDNYQSNNGLSWNVSGVYPEYAINATPIPEPSLLGLLGLGGLFFVRYRRRQS